MPKAKNSQESSLPSIPPDLAEALAKVKGARAKFDAMAPSHRRKWVRTIEDAKKPQTRQRRLENAVKAMQTR